MQTGEINRTTGRGGYIRVDGEKDLIPFDWAHCRSMSPNECGHGTKVTFYTDIENGRRRAYAVTRRTA